MARTVLTSYPPVHASFAGVATATKVSSSAAVAYPVIALTTVTDLVGDTVLAEVWAALASGAVVRVGGSVAVDGRTGEATLTAVALGGTCSDATSAASALVAAWSGAGSPVVS